MVTAVVASAAIPIAETAWGSLAVYETARPHRGIPLSAFFS
jgi:hypothetical protein